MKSSTISKSITNKDEESLRIYFKEISKIPLLSASEEVEIAKKIKEGDKKALDRLVTANLRFVISIAKQYQGQGLGLADLISEGTIGLIEGAKKFDADKGYRFISYAVWWIRQKIIKALSNYSRTIRVPIGKVSGAIKILKFITQYEQKYEKKPTNEEIAKELKISEEAVVDYLTASSQCISVDTPIGEEDSSLIDIIPNTTIQDADFDAQITDKDIFVEELLSHLDDRERDILVMYFGLLGVKPLETIEIGKRFALTKERIYQLKKSALLKLKQYNEDLKNLL